MKNSNLELYDYHYDTVKSGIRMLDERLKSTNQPIPDKHNTADTRYAKHFKAFNTFRFYIGRQCGASTTIARLCELHDIIIVHSDHAVETMLKRINQLSFESPQIVNWYRSTETIFEFDLVNKPTIWIDCPSLLCEDMIDDIYFEFAEQASKFVLLGE